MSAETVRAEKRAMRDEMKLALDALTEPQRTQDAEAVAHALAALDEYTQAHTVMVYASTPDELSLDPFIAIALKGSKRVCVPRVDWETRSMAPARIENLDTDLTEGRYSIRVPSPRCAGVDPSEIGLVCVPALALDPRGGRLGRGAGFYDRWIQRRRAERTTCVFAGVAHDTQLVGRVPTDPHDQTLDLVVTPTRTERPERSTDP